MSLYFNWSCDFQRFTKSKKLSKFQVRTTTLFISNKSLSTSLFNLQGTICCFQRVFTTFRCSQPLINSLFSIPQYTPNVNTFLQLFQKNILQEICTLYTYLYKYGSPVQMPYKTSPTAVRRQAQKIMQRTIFPMIFQYSVVIFIAYC